MSDFDARIKALEAEVKELRGLMIGRRLDYIERKIGMQPKDYVRDYTEDDEYLPSCQR